MTELEKAQLKLECLKLTINDMAGKRPLEEATKDADKIYEYILKKD